MPDVFGIVSSDITPHPTEAGGHGTTGEGLLAGHMQEFDKFINSLFDGATDRVKQGMGIAAGVATAVAGLSHSLGGLSPSVPYNPGFQLSAGSHAAAPVASAVQPMAAPSLSANVIALVGAQDKGFAMISGGQNADFNSIQVPTAMISMNTSMRAAGIGGGHEADFNSISIPSMIPSMGQPQGMSLAA